MQLSGMATIAVATIAVASIVVWLSGTAVAQGADTRDGLSAPAQPMADDGVRWIDRAPAATEGLSLMSAPSNTLELRARRGRWSRRGGEAARRPSFALGAGVASWKPKDAGAAAAVLQGFLRGYLNSTTALQVEAGYWSHTEERFTVGVLGGQPASGAGYDKLEDVPVGLSLIYFIRPPSRGAGRSGRGAALYGGMGVARHTWKETSNYGNPIALAATQSAFGYHYIAGLEVGRARGTHLFGEYRYVVGRVDNLAGLPLKFDGSSIGGGLIVSF